MIEQSTLTGLGMRFSYIVINHTQMQDLKAGMRDLKIRNQCKINNVVPFAYIYFGLYSKTGNNYCVHLSVFPVALLTSMFISKD